MKRLENLMKKIENWLREPPGWFLDLGVGLCCGMLVLGVWLMVWGVMSL